MHDLVNEGIIPCRITPEQFEIEVAPPVSPPSPPLLKVGFPVGGVVTLFTRKLGNTARTQGTRSDVRGAIMEEATSMSQRNVTALLSHEHRKLQLLLPRLRSTQRPTSATGPFLIQLSASFVMAFVAPIGVTRQEMLMVVAGPRTADDDAHAKGTVMANGTTTDKVNAAGTNRRKPSRHGARPREMHEGDAQESNDTATCASAPRAPTLDCLCAPTAVGPHVDRGARGHYTRRAVAHRFRPEQAAACSAS
jgi:hypothetical protein